MIKHSTGKCFYVVNAHHHEFIFLHHIDCFLEENKCCLFGSNLQATFLDPIISSPANSSNVIVVDGCGYNLAFDNVLMKFIPMVFKKDIIPGSMIFIL